MKNIIIFGGAFDPVHRGHMQMAITASKTLAGEVFFVPARISVWKNDSAQVSDKIELLRLAIKEYGMEDTLKVSLYEANSDKEINYSIDTVKHFKEDFKNDKLYLLIGTDQVNSFHKWKDADEIASLCQIVFYNRPGLELDEGNVERFHMQEIKGEMVEASSTGLRSLNELDMPYSCIKYVVEHNMYFVPKVRSFLSDKRFNHSYEVAKLAYEIAVSNDLEHPEHYFVAGILHDIGKEMKMDDQKKIMKEFYSEYLDVPPVIYHQFMGEYLAKKEFGIQEKGILEAIKWHTTGNVDLGSIAMVIYASDKIEPTRGFDSSSLITSMMDNWENGFLTVLQANKEYFIQKGIAYDNKLTAACMESYLGK